MKSPKAEVQSRSEPTKKRKSKAEVEVEENLQKKRIPKPKSKVETNRKPIKEKRRTLVLTFRQIKE